MKANIEEVEVDVRNMLINACELFNIGDIDILQGYQAKAYQPKRDTIFFYIKNSNNNYYLTNKEIIFDTELQEYFYIHSIFKHIKIDINVYKRNEKNNRTASQILKAIEAYYLTNDFISNNGYSQFGLLNINRDDIIDLNEEYQILPSMTMELGYRELLKKEKIDNTDKIYGKIYNI